MNELKEEKTAGSRLHCFPVSFFAIVMGLTGFAVALTKAEEVLGLNVHPATEVTGLAAVIFLLILITYLAKIWHHPLAVGKELRHPVKLSFLPTISISPILLSVALLNKASGASLWLWSIGSACIAIATHPFCHVPLDQRHPFWGSPFQSILVLFQFWPAVLASPAYSHHQPGNFSSPNA